MTFFDVDRGIEYMTPEWVLDRVDEINQISMDASMKASLERYLYRTVLEQVANKNVENPSLCAQIALKI